MPIKSLPYDVISFLPQILQGRNRTKGLPCCDYTFPGSLIIFFSFLNTGTISPWRAAVPPHLPAAFPPSTWDLALHFLKLIGAKLPMGLSLACAGAGFVPEVWSVLWQVMLVVDFLQTRGLGPPPAPDEPSWLHRDPHLTQINQLQMLKYQQLPTALSKTQGQDMPLCTETPNSGDKYSTQSSLQVLTQIQTFSSLYIFSPF